MFSLFKKKKEEEQKQLVAYISGKVIPIEQVNDPTFAEKMLGDGIAIEPIENIIVSPGNGIVTMVMADSKHAVGITLNNGIEILIHEGLDTVNLQGKGFELYVKEGQKVKAGDKLLSFDEKILKEHKLDKTCIMVVLNSSEHSDLRFYTELEVMAGETVVAEKMD